MNTVLPKLIDVNVSFAVIHEQPLGWELNFDADLDAHTLTFKSNLFPYGAVLENTDTITSVDTSTADPAEDESAASTASNAENIAAEQEAISSDFGGTADYAEQAGWAFFDD